MTLASSGGGHRLSRKQTSRSRRGPEIVLYRPQRLSRHRRSGAGASHQNALACKYFQPTYLPTYLPTNMRRKMTFVRGELPIGMPEACKEWVKNRCCISL